jgi:hypothetical protein
MSQYITPGSITLLALLIFAANIAYRTYTTPERARRRAKRKAEQSLRQMAKGRKP